MIYAHGSYEIPVRVLEVSSLPERNADGVLVLSRKMIAIEGAVRADNQSDLDDAIRELESAFLDETVTKSGLKLNDGTTDSAHTLDATATPTENGIVARLSWIDEPAAFVRRRSFRAVVEMTALGDGADEAEYANRIIRSGNGGPIDIPRLTLGGVVIQQVYPASPYTGFESGRKVSRLGSLVVPGPTFPEIEQGSQRQIESGVDVAANGLRRYFATWNYSYLSATAF